MPTQKNLSPGVSNRKKPVKKKEKRVKKGFSLNKTFNLSRKKDVIISGYDAPTEHTPKIDSRYVFSEEETSALIMAMEGKDPTLLLGSTGVGKTSVIEQIGARLNYNVIKINFDSSVLRSDLIGEWVVKGKEMQFQYGIIPVAFKMPGTIIILDEWDAQNEETAFVLQRPLEKDDRKIFLLETLELVEMHEDNFICATANTNGQGDDTGLYSQGTRLQSYAQLNRFTVTVKMDYLDERQEFEVVKNKFPALEDLEIETIVSSVGKIREGFLNGQISVPLSTRDVINWADKYIKLGDVFKSAKYCFLNRMNSEDARVCSEILQRFVG